MEKISLAINNYFFLTVYYIKQAVSCINYVVKGCLNNDF